MTATIRIAVALAATAVLASAAAAAEAPATLANLHAAWASDVQAQARYRAFAERADQDGRGGDAALFRAAAHAEGVRARLHAEVIRHLGAEPRMASAEAPIVRATRANLVSTLAEENSERAAEYPRWVDQARRDGVPEAVLAFTLAHHAQPSLVSLLQDAVTRRNATAGTELHVCETCGMLVRGPAPERCPVSLSPRAAFTRIR